MFLKMFIFYLIYTYIGKEVNENCLIWLLYIKA